MKKLLGTISPVYGMATGQGLFGQGIGLLPAIAKELRGDKEEEERKAAEAAAMAEASAAQGGMKRGGKVKKMASGGSASKRADGIAQRGKTRGKMV
jgi:hypothetical protein